MIFSILLIHFASAGYITTWDLSLQYDIEGKLSQILIPFSLENTINSGYLQFGGASLHKTSMSEVTCIISTLDGQQLMSATASVTTQPSFTSDYYFLVSVQLSADTWYQLQIYPTQVDSGFYYEPITLRTISSLDDNAMIYDYNYGAGFLNVDDLPPSGMTVTFNVDETLYPNYLLPGAQYVITIDITPRQATDAAEIDLQIVKGSHTDGIDDTDYQILSSSCWSSFTDYTCTTTQNSVKLVTSNSVVANIKMQVQFGVENPGFVSNRDIRIVTKSPSKGYRIIEKGVRTNVFQVSPVPTQLQGVEYLWGVDYLEDLTDTVVGVFQAQDLSQFYGPYNSIKISFSVSASVNLIAPLVVSVKLGCFYALSYATKHNFQQYDDQNPVYCNFVTDTMICHNVGTLSSSSVYYISTKAIFDNSPGSGEFGTFSFYLDNQGTQLQIYAQSAGITVLPIIDQPFLDTTGWHSGTGYLGQTQVVSIPDTSLTSLGSVFGSSGAVGIVNGDNMILFFLKVPSGNYWDATVPSCPSNSVQTKMTIMMNNQMLHSDQNNLPKKLQYLANDGGGVYSDDQFKCIQTGLCDVGDQNTYTIYSATNTGYGVATFSCGNGCSSNFVTECNNFMGTTALPTQGSNGVVGIPVSFSASFKHSSQYADEQLIDFVVSFYKVTSAGQTRLSSHLINGYTITRVMDIKAGFVNYYMGTTTGNNGNYIPTMFRVKMPSLTISYDKIQVFFDTKIQLFSSYSGCQVFNALQSPTEAWMLFQSVICDKADQVLLPVIPNGLTKTVYIALTTTVDGIISQVPVRVYRAYGLPVNSETRKVTVSPFTTETADLTLPFVRGAYAFNMQIDTTQFVTGQATTELIATTSSSSTVPLEQNQNTYIGAGLTLTSSGINVFEDATISSYFGSLSCAQVFYNTNMYAIFCPFDTKIHYPLTVANEVVFVLGQYTKLGSFISYGVSGAKGLLMAAMNDPGSIGRLLYTCTLDKTNTLHSNSLGQQRVQFPIRFSSAIKLGGQYYGSVKVVISILLAINGVNVVTSTSICGIQGLSSVTCIYTSTATVLTVTLTSSIQQTIATNTVIYLTFQLQSTFGLTSFGSNQPFTVSIYVPTVRSGRTQTYGDSYDTPAVLQEQCTYTQLTLSNSQLGNTFYVGNLKLEIPITNAVGTLVFDFGLKSARDYLSASQSYVLLSLGFLSDSNSVLNCQIYENNALSTLIYSIDTSALPSIVVKFNQDFTNPHNRVFQMRCHNYKTPTNALQTDSFIGKLIDKVGTTTVQSSAPIGYSSLSSVSYTVQGSIILKSKSLNSPGFNSIYQFAITNGDLKILLTYLIKFRFHEGISQSGSVSCQMNGTFCYCSQQGGLYTIDACVAIQPTQLVIITITLPQPNRLLWPTSPNIYVAVDQDDDFSNGVYMQAVLTDFLGDDYETQAMEVVDTTISSQYIRTTQTHKLSLLFPSGSVSAGNILYVEFPSFYMDPLSRAVNITCTLTRDDDNTQTNFTTTCNILTSQYISMVLSQDSSNNLIKQYTLQLGNIPLPQKKVPSDPLNDFRIKVHISQSGDTRAKFTSAFYYSVPLYLISEDKEDVQWSGSQFKYERDEALTLVGSSNDIIKIYQGTFRTLIKLSPLDQLNFAETFGFQASGGLVAFPSTLQASSGSSSANFLVGTLNTIGYQVFQFTKLTGGSNYVSTLPNIYAKVVNEPCQLTTPQLIYQIVEGGVSQPIIVDVQSCFPMSDLRIQLMNNNASLNVISNNPQNILYDGNAGYKLFFDQFQYIWEVSNNDTLELNSTVELWFSLTGVSSQYYTAPPNITIVIVESTSTPILVFSSQPVAYKNKILFTFNCSTVGTLFWVIGCGDNIGYIPLGEIYNRTIYEGYSRTLRNLSDTEWKIYGMQLLDGTPVQESFNGLKSYSDYSIIGYCVDSTGSTSDALSFDWQTSFNGGSGIKLNITFSSSLTTTQALELVCGINLIFPIDYTNICNQQGYQCDLDTLTTLSASTDAINVLDGVVTSYYIYIQPDLSLMTETINNLVEAQLQNKATFYSLLQNKMSLDIEQDPTIISVTYSEPDQATQPTLNHTTPVVGSINATMNFTLSKAPGYVGIGLEQTDTSSIPTITQLRRSINYLGRSLDQSFLLFFNYSSSIQNETKQVVFKDLSPNLKYQIYWFYSNDDAGPLTLVSNVSMVQIQTSPSQTYSFGTIIVVIVSLWIA